jgi:predicted transcriptional regulator
MPGQRAIMRIQLDADAKEELDRLCDKRGMTQIAVMSRLVGWFVKQDEVIQTAVMASLSEPTLGKLAKQILKRISSHGKDSK